MWTAPASEHINGVIHHYEAVLTEMDSSRSPTGVKYSLNASSTIASFLNLHPYYYYQCSVAAYTVALGPTSESILARLEEDGKHKANHCHWGLFTAMPVLYSSYRVSNKCYRHGFVS